MHFHHAYKEQIEGEAPRCPGMVSPSFVLWEESLFLPASSLSVDRLVSCVSLWCTHKGMGLYIL